MFVCDIICYFKLCVRNQVNETTDLDRMGHLGDPDHLILLIRESPALVNEGQDLSEEVVCLNTIHWLTFQAYAVHHMERYKSKNQDEREDQKQLPCSFKLPS